MDWMRDGIWQFVGAALALAALIASYIFNRRQMIRKELAYELIHQAHISWHDNTRLSKPGATRHTRPR